MGNDTTRRRTGSLRQKPNGRWLATIERGTRADGTRRTASRTFGTKREAEAWLTATSATLGDRPDLGAGVTLEQLWQVYRLGKSVTKKTMYDYGWIMESLWLPEFGDGDVTLLAPHRVQSVLDGLTYESAKHARAALSSVLSFGVERGILTRHPLAGHRFSYPERAKGLDFDDDPFAAIERSRDVWGVQTVLRCYELIPGLPLEPAWLACVGAGLRVEEALALRGVDVRRIDVGGRAVTQLAVHSARTAMDGHKATKTPQSRRIVGMLEPFGLRYWQIAQAAARSDLVCAVSAANQNKRWRGYFAEPSTSKHAPRKEGCNYLGRLRELPYLPLSKMRNTHVTIMAEAGVSDAVNALMHGHTEMVERTNYLAPDLTAATVRASEHLQMVI